MKGRLHYDGVNTAIDEFNTALKARYSFLSKGFKAMASMAMKKRYKVICIFHCVMQMKFLILVF